MKKEVRKRRRVYQRARKSGKDEARRLYAVYNECLREYKRSDAAKGK